jgi:macrodomain Ter protein organizer (MatP/YcbG family)
MQSVLTEKLWAYIVHNNPDLMISLQEDYSVTRYLEEKVNAVLPMVEQLLGEGRAPYIIEELCLNAMTEELQPSRYQYIRSVIEEEFNGDYERMKENGTLTYEVVNLIETCKGIFSDFDFNSENETNRNLRYAIIGQVHDYLA